MTTESPHEVEGKRTEWQRAVDSVLHKHGQRLTQIEQTEAVYKALSDERTRHLDDRFNRLEDAQEKAAQRNDEKFSKIDANISWIVRLLIGAIILAFVQFALSGGLKLPI